MTGKIQVIIYSGFMKLQEEEEDFDNGNYNKITSYRNNHGRFCRRPYRCGVKI